VGTFNIGFIQGVPEKTAQRLPCN